MNILETSPEPKKELKKSSVKSFGLDQRLGICRPHFSSLYAKHLRINHDKAVSGDGMGMKGEC